MEIFSIFKKFTCPREEPLILINLPFLSMSREFGLERGIINEVRILSMSRKFGLDEGYE